MHLYSSIRLVWQVTFQLHLRHWSVGLLGHLRPVESYGYLGRLDWRHRIGSWLLPPSYGGAVVHQHCHIPAVSKTALNYSYLLIQS